MTSNRKVTASRENARASTGPKTAHGRARAARNALRHALSLPIYSNPGLSEEVEALAEEIAGAGANDEIRELARRVAEAQIDLRRVRSARHQFLSKEFSDPYYDDRANIRKKPALLHAMMRKNAPNIPPTALEDFLTCAPEGQLKFASIISQEMKRLQAFDRYEHRALSRRTSAIRTLDMVRLRFVSI